MLRLVHEPLDSPGKSSAFVDIHICLPVFVFRLSRKGMHRLRVRLSVPVGIVNKREGIQNPTLKAKVGQAYPKKIILMSDYLKK